MVSCNVIENFVLGYGLFFFIFVLKKFFFLTNPFQCPLNFVAEYVAEYENYKRKADNNAGVIVTYAYVIF